MAASSQGEAARTAAGLKFETRSSDSLWIQSVWTCRSGKVAEMTSVATETWGLVFWEREGRSHAAITGPESGTGTAPVPEGADFMGIQFAVGTSLRSVSASALVDRAIALPDAQKSSFWLDDCRWGIPGADDAEALVARLAAREALVSDALVVEAQRGGPPRVSDRALQRRFRAATGLTRGAVRQIQRARTAAGLLASGEPVSEVAGSLGYYDEPHLARALRGYVGRTAGQLREGTGGALALDPAHRTTS